MLNDCFVCVRSAKMHKHINITPSHRHRHRQRIIDLAPTAISGECATCALEFSHTHWKRISNRSYCIRYIFSDHDDHARNDDGSHNFSYGRLPLPNFPRHAMNQAISDAYLSISSLLHLTSAVIPVYFQFNIYVQSMRVCAFPTLRSDGYYV